VKRGLVVKRHNYFVLMGRIEAPLLHSSLTQSGTYNYQTNKAKKKNTHTHTHKLYPIKLNNHSTPAKFSWNTSLHRCWHLR